MKLANPSDMGRRRQFEDALRRFFGGIHVVLVVAVAFFQARSVVDWTVEKAETTLALVGVSSKPAVVERELKRQSKARAYPILERNPFDSQTGSLLVKRDAAPDGRERGGPLPNCHELVVTIVSQAVDPNASAVTARHGRGEPSLLHLGDRLGQGRVVFIGDTPQPDRRRRPSLWLEAADGSLCQALLGAKPAEPANEAPASSRASHAIPKLGRTTDGDLELPASELERLLQDPGALLRGARYVREKGSSSFRLLRVSPDSAAAQLGLRAGDRLLDVSGARLTSPDDLLRLYASLPRRQQLILSFERRGSRGSYEKQELVLRLLH